jgi:hypothetical protein
MCKKKSEDIIRGLQINVISDTVTVYRYKWWNVLKGWTRIASRTDMNYGRREEKNVRRLTRH